MQTQIIKHDEDGNMQRAQGTTGSTCTDKRAGFVFFSEALQIAQQSTQARAWARFPDIEGEAPTRAAPGAPRAQTLAQMRRDALAAMRAAA